MDIYAYTYDTFVIFTENLNLLHIGNKDLIVKDILDFLTNKNDKYDEEYMKIVTSEFKNIESIKRVIMLIIASKSYMFNYYDYWHEINIEQSKNMLEEIESMSMQQIIRAFYKRDELVECLLEDFFSYINRPYIFQNKCKSLIIANGKKDIILKINPFEALDLYDCIDDDKYTNSEICIQLFMDFYDKSLLYSFNDDYGEADQYSCSEEFLVETFISKLRNYFNDEKKFVIFIRYIISNVYETIITELNCDNHDYKKYLDIVYSVENCKIDEILSRFLSDYKFALNIIDAFLEGNDYLVEGDLLGKREMFKKSGNISLLRKLNPFYLEEEIIYKKIKETSEN